MRRDTAMVVVGAMQAIALLTASVVLAGGGA